MHRKGDRHHRFLAPGKYHGRNQCGAFNMKIKQLEPGRYDQMIDRYIEAGQAEKPSIANEIEDVFSRDVTVFVLDISGFSRITAKRGIVFYLAMIRRMQRLSEQMIAEHDGKVIKFVADNLFATFTCVDNAINFAWSLNQGFEGMNVITEEDADIHISVGIASGPVLIIDEHDMWGDAMNMASKLGEDMAKAGEILVHRSSLPRMADPSRYATKPRNYRISGMMIDALEITDVFA